MHQLRALGIPWYRREDYRRLLALFADAGKLPPTYDKWLGAAERGEKAQQRAGVLVERVHLDPDEFAEWCRRRQMPVDAQARIAFVNEAVARKYRSQH